MELIQLVILAVGLSMDSLAIALTSGAIIKSHHTMDVLKISGMLAFIQMSLIAIGWYLGAQFIDYFRDYDHWIAFVILGFLGGKVIYETINENDEESKFFNPLKFTIMFTLAIAASIDAAAAGLSLSCIGGSILLTATIVGIVTLVLSSFGVVCGCKVGCKCTKKVNLIGGVILILIGCTILAEHTILQDDKFLTFLQ